MSSPAGRAVIAGAGRRLALSNIVPFVQGTGSGALDVPVTTRTGKILLLIVCGDVSSTVESPYTITYDLGGSANVFTQHKVVNGGEASTRPRLIIASVTGVPITGQVKNIRFATAASTLSGWNIVTADLPAWWSGTIGNVDASAAHVTKASHTSPSIVTGAAKSLLVGCGGTLDATLGPLALSGQGGAWSLLVPQTAAGVLATNWQAVFCSKIVPRKGATVDLGLALASGGNANDWSAGVIEIRP